MAEHEGRVHGTGGHTQREELMRLPVFRSLSDPKLPGDLVAGLTVWAVLVPEALAYASIAGVSPVIGLYAAPGALILYAAFGSSRQLVTGPGAATAALSAAIVGDLVTQGASDYVQLTATLAITVGLLAIAASVLRLGFVANFISEPVLKGFIIGLALTVIVGQLPKLFGIEKGGGNFFEQLSEFVTHLDETSFLTLLVGALSLALVIGLKAWRPVIPASLVAVLLGILAVHLFGLDGVAIVGPIQSGLPSFGVPDVSGSDLLGLLGASLGVMVIAFAEGLGAAKTYAAKEGYEIDANRELLGLGAANIGAGLSSGMVVSGSLSKTAVNASAGGKSQLAGLVTAVLVVVTLLFLTGLFEDLPEATLAAVVIASLIELVDIPSLVNLYRAHTKSLGRIYGFAARPDFIAAIAAVLGVLVFDTLPGLVIGIVTSVLLLLYRASIPHVAVLAQASGADGPFVDAKRDPEAAEVPGVAILRVESALFFANADAVRDHIRAHAADGHIKAVVIDAETVPAIDVTAGAMLFGMGRELRSQGKRLVLAREIGQVRDAIDTTGSESAPSELENYPTVRAAVAALREDLTPAGRAETREERRDP
jgi:SulP family sulfate permease